MGKRLYVGNLPYDTDEASLREAFSQGGGTVERVHIVLDRETQRPRGFAFIEMATDDQAKAAMAAMDGAMFGTRQLRVTEAEDRRPGFGGGPGGPRPAGAGFGGPRPAGPGGGGGGGFGGPRPAGPGAGPGGPARPADDANRPRNFGPDARPKHERAREIEQRRASQQRRRGGDGSEDPFHGRRGSRRFEDDDEE